MYRMYRKLHICTMLTLRIKQSPKSRQQQGEQKDIQQVGSELAPWLRILRPAHKGLNDGKWEIGKSNKIPCHHSLLPPCVSQQMLSSMNTVSCGRKQHSTWEEARAWVWERTSLQEPGLLPWKHTRTPPYYNFYSIRMHVHTCQLQARAQMVVNCITHLSLFGLWRNA